MSARANQRLNGPIRVVRVIARLNIGGPAIQAIMLTKRLEEYGYETRLVRGREEPDEGNMDYLADEFGVRPVLVPWMRRNPSSRDLPALISLVRIIRRERPQIVHTHAAKGGTLGRVATLIAFPRKRRRPIVIHTYHGHSLIGYFSPRTAWVYRRIEQLLGGFTDRLIAVSEEVRDELVAMGVAPSSGFEVVRLGFDFSPFMVRGRVRDEMREAVRGELGIPSDARVVTLIARLVPIKRVDRFLRVANALRDLDDVRFLIVGDGEMRESLHSSAEALALGDRLVWAGFRRDMPAVFFASDVVVQTSDNEGTPVALIEAQAAGVPVVSTNVGGVASALAEGQLLALPQDEQALASAARLVLSDSAAASDTAAGGRDRILGRFDVVRLNQEIAMLYARLLTQSRTASAGGSDGPCSTQARLSPCAHS